MKHAFVKFKSKGAYSQGKYVTVEMKDKESKADYEKRTWKEKAHYDKDTGEVYIPAMAFANSLKQAAKYLSLPIKGKGKATYTKNFEAGTLVTENIPIGINIKDVLCDEVFVPSDGVKGSGKRVLKYFPKVLQWEAEVEYLIMDNIITESVFRTTLECSGSLIGIGVFRPRNGGYFGRFEITDLQWKDDEIKS